ncbi:rho GTPase-activating protein 39-like isoform X3 [Bolinopsis microptera]|uniref:rho GTPase-activating protein 39-like isoform X3 n=1 Tax=Bolinopsis microptera TaxID=2820187 RepID=UPI00307AD447
MASGVEWVEIQCPRTGEPMFANLDTGECLWEAPLGATVKGSSVNQWWELYDPNSNKNYYHNSTTGETVWKKPRGAEILPLTKLQAKSGPQNHARNGSKYGPTDTLSNNNTASRPSPNKTPSHREEVLAVSTTATLDRNSLNSNPPPISPYAVKPMIGQNNHQQSIKPNKRGKLPPPIATKPATLKRPARISNAGAKTQGEDTPGSTTDTTSTRTDTHTDTTKGDDPPPLTAVKQVESSVDSSREGSAASDPMNQFLVPSRNLSSTGRSIENLSNIDSDGEQIPDIPAMANHDYNHGNDHNSSVRSNIDKIKQNRQDTRFSSFHDYGAPVKYSASTPSDPRNTPLPGKENDTTPSMEAGVSPVRIEVDEADDDNNDADDELLEDELVECDGCFFDSEDQDSLLFEDAAGHVFQWLKKRRHSAELSPAPNKDKKGGKKPPVIRSPTSPIPKLPKEKEFVKKHINRPRGFIKKVSIATMLAHSKDQIKKPIILTQDKEVRKDAVIWFKNLQEYMGDTKVGKGLKDKERLKRAAELTFNGWQKVCFRDEFFMQVIKQTTCNNKSKSLEWGWKLISAYLYYFPPTIRFQGYLEGYLYKNKENDLNQCEVPVQLYAEYCHERLAKMITRGAKHGQKKPTDDDIAHAMQLPFKKSMFGATLEEVMELQKETHPDRHLPWVLTLLAGKVIEYGGFSTEGIFRVPGDIDKVCSLKVSLDNGEYLAEFPTTDAPVCASLLKEWTRELYDPAICHDTYQKCLDNCENATFCSTIVSELPAINRLVVTFVIRFLQGFLTEETIKKTKMTADNLAMVFAPNLLRCPSTDLQVAMDNSKWEMTFVRTLINHLDTSYMEGVV